MVVPQLEPKLGSSRAEQNAMRIPVAA